MTTRLPTARPGVQPAPCCASRAIFSGSFWWCDSPWCASGTPIAMRYPTPRWLSMQVRLAAPSASLRRMLLTKLRTRFASVFPGLAQTRRSSVSKVTTRPASSESTRSRSSSVTVSSTASPRSVTRRCA